MKTNNEKLRIEKENVPDQKKSPVKEEPKKHG